MVDLFSLSWDNLGSLFEAIPHEGLLCFPLSGSSIMELRICRLLVSPACSLHSCKPERAISKETTTTEKNNMSVAEPQRDCISDYEAISEAPWLFFCIFLCRGGSLFLLTAFIHTNRLLYDHEARHPISCSCFLHLPTEKHFC